MLTDRSGAHRVYGLRPGMRVRTWNGDRAVVDSDGRSWELTEAGLVRDGVALPRLPSHNAFWFGWRAAHPDTTLIAEDRVAP